MPHRHILRFATVLLLAWIAVDLAAIHTCALDDARAPSPPGTTVAAPDGPGASARQQTPLHPDHCFCRGLSTGADITAALIDPVLIGQTVEDAPPGHLIRISAALFHPPQLAA